MKKARRLVSLVLALSMILGLSINVLANESDSTGSWLTKEDLPVYLQGTLPDETIAIQDEDGIYHIGIPNPSSVQFRGGERYAPDGGTYTDLSNDTYPYLNGTYIYSMTYFPPEFVQAWLIDQVPDVKEAVLDILIDYGISKAIQYASAALGISVSAEALTILASIEKYVITGLNASMVKSISENGTKGILIYYLTSVYAGSMPVYEPWNNYPYVPTWPNGGSAVWHEKYYNLNLG